MPPVGYEGHCHFCSEPVYRQHGVCFGVIGWEAVRSQGGANQIIMRTRVPEKVAHPHCVRFANDRMKRGIALDQGALDFG